MRSLQFISACLPILSLLLAAADVSAQMPGGMGAGRGPMQGGRGPANQPFGGQGMMPGARPLHRGIDMRSYVFEPTGEKLAYGVFVPRKLDRSKPAPLIIALHAANAAPEAILNPLASAADKRGYIMVAPMGYGPVGWYGFERRLAGRAERETSALSEIDVMNVLRMARAEFNIDPRRIYVAGASMGGVGAVHLASKYKDLFAAVGVISPAITSNIPEEFDSYDGAPVVVLHGDRDDSVPVDLVRGWVAHLKAKAVPHYYFQYRGGTHLSVVQDSGERVLSWFDKYSRPETSPAP